MILVFRDSWPLVSRLTLAFRIQIAMLAAVWPWLLLVSWWPWLLTGATALALTTAWTAHRLRRARRHLEQRVAQAREGLLSRGDIQSDPEVLERLG